jgi:hypothetical protein
MCNLVAIYWHFARKYWLHLQGMFWNVMPYSLVEVNRRFGGMYCLRLHVAQFILVYAYRCFGEIYCLGLQDISWDIMPCILVYAYRCFGGPYWLHIQCTFWCVILCNNESLTTFHRNLIPQCRERGQSLKCHIIDGYYLHSEDDGFESLPRDRLSRL